jgi:tungstate transport system substrate-binding protein
LNLVVRNVRMEIFMGQRKTIWFLILTLVLSALACNLPQPGSAPTAAPTDTGLQAPTQPAGQGAVVTSAAPAAQSTPQPPAAGGASPDNEKLTLGTTSVLVGSGMIEKLLGPFQAKTGYEVKVEKGGAGRAIKLGEKYVADVLLVNEPGSEIKFVEEGNGKDRLPVMYSDYVLIGPASDPAGVKSAAKAKEAFKKIADTQSLFVTRSDNLGAQGAETKLWKAAGVSPQGTWYVFSDQGPVGALKLASDGQGYTLTDRVTFLQNKDQFQLEVLYEGDELMRDYYHVVTVNPDRSPKINYAGAQALAQFITSPEGQAIIQQIGVDQYGQPIFFPAAQQP